MKPQHVPRHSPKMKQKDPVEIRSMMSAGELSEIPQVTDPTEASQDYLRTLVSIATNTWRAKTKMVDPATGEIREELKRVGRHIEAIYRNLAEAGIVIRDHTGEAYDEGQPMKVIASKPTSGQGKKRVSETLLPSIFWRDRLVQNGEIEIAIPVISNTST
jgi:hypothetical protein